MAGIIVEYRKLDGSFQKAIYYANEQTPVFTKHNMALVHLVDKDLKTQYGRGSKANRPAMDVVKLFRLDPKGTVD